MTKTRWILLLRDIKKSMAVFLSITIIVTLGILVYIGISFSSMGTKDTMNHFFQTTSYMDFQIHSSTGFTDDDISAVLALDDVATAEGGYETSAYIEPATGDKNKLVVSVQSLTEKLNTITLIEGRLPEAPNECVIESLLSDQLQIGDTIQVDARDSNHISLLAEETFVVTGIINHPFNMVDIEERRGISVLGNGCIQNFIYVDSSAFDSPLLANRYLTLYVKADTNAHTYSEEYSAFSDKVEASLQAIGDERAGTESGIHENQALYTFASQYY